VTGADPGHVFPTAGLAKRLIAAGHRASVLTVDKWLDPLRNDGIAATAITITPRHPERLADFGYRLHGLAGESAPVIAAVLEKLRPDLVVADVLSAGGGLAAELTGLPWAELVPHVLHLPSVVLPPPGSGLRPGRTPLGRGRDALLRRLSDRSRRAGDLQRIAVRRELGLPGDPPQPAARLVATLPALEPDRPDWPAHTDIVGPLLWDPATVELPRPAGDAPLVLVVGSTSSSGRPGLFEAALAIDGVRLAAPMLREYEGAVPPNAVAGPGRLTPLVDDAAVVISGAGHGMVGRALTAGKPLVLVPGGGDQRELANRVARLGAGIVVHRLGRIAAATRRILRDESYAIAAGRIAATRPSTDPVSACERAAERAG
jgi:UDP:flavonoid glycosyltransferase YjiC (YdhE family)